MLDERFGYDPETERTVVKQRNERLPEQAEQETAGPTFAEGRQRLARALKTMEQMTERNNHE